jgi:hypothetical protein
VKVDFSAFIGVPVIVPATRFKPVGNEPLAILHVMGEFPFASSFLLYVIPTVPFGNDDVVISGEPSSSSQSQAAIENPITATMAAKPINLIVFFIKNSFV